MTHSAFISAALVAALLAASPAAALSPTTVSAKTAHTPKQHAMAQSTQQPEETQAQAATKIETIHAEKAFARPTYGQTKVGAGFIEIHNLAPQDDTLIEASTPMAEATELHSNVTEGDIMRMRRVNNIAVPANGAVTLSPGGLHLMFFRLKEPLKEGMQFPVRLVFAKAGPKDVTFTVKQK